MGWNERTCWGTREDYSSDEQGPGSADAAVNNIDYTQSIPENIVRIAVHDGIRSSGSALE